MYNGHKDWNHWNVSLWINNDEGLYLTARDFVRTSKNKTEAAVRMVDFMASFNGGKTPDGALYNVPSVRAAMVDM